MEVKKIPEVDITKRSSMFLMVGLIASLGLTLVAFEWKKYDLGELMDLGAANDDFEELMEIPPTIQPPPTPPPLQQPQVIAVPDDEEIDEQIEIDLDVDLTEDTIMEEVIFDPEPSEEIAEDVVVFAEQEATFPGGWDKWKKFLNKNLKYPKRAKRMGISGTVFLSFIVDKNGVISDIEVLRAVGGGLDEEAIRVLKASPKWNPGLQRGRPVKSRMSIRIAFTLR